MFQFSGFPSHDYVFIIRYLDITLSEFPHSEIFGSKFTCNSPKLIAAYHVLHRLLMPRHSPCALCSLTFTRLLYLITSSTVKSIHSRTQVLFISYLSCFLVLSYIKLRNLSVKNFQSFAFNIFATTLNYFRVVSSNYQIKI